MRQVRALAIQFPFQRLCLFQVHDPALNPGPCLTLFAGDGVRSAGCFQGPPVLGDHSFHSCTLGLNPFSLKERPEFFDTSPLFKFFEPCSTAPHPSPPPPPTLSFPFLFFFFFFFFVFFLLFGFFFFFFFFFFVGGGLVCFLGLTTFPVFFLRLLYQVVARPALFYAVGFFGAVGFPPVDLYAAFVVLFGFPRFGKVCY